MDTLIYLSQFVYLLSVLFSFILSMSYSLHIFEIFCCRFRMVESFVISYKKTRKLPISIVYMIVRLVC